MTTLKEKRNILTLRYDELMYFKHAMPRPIVVDWFKKYFRNWHYRHGPIRVLFHAGIDNGTEAYVEDTFMAVHDRTWIKASLARGEDVHVLTMTTDLDNEINHWLDYFDTLPNEPLTFSVPQLRKKIKRWDATFQKKMKADLRVGTKVVPIPALFNTRLYVVKLLTKEAYVTEGSVMNHCVDSYWNAGKGVGLRNYDSMFLQSRRSIYSVRSLDEYKPLATLEIISSELDMLRAPPSLTGFRQAFKWSCLSVTRTSRYLWVRRSRLKKHLSLIEIDVELKLYRSIIQTLPSLIPLDTGADPRFPSDEQLVIDKYKYVTRVAQQKAFSNAVPSEEAKVAIQALKDTFVQKPNQTYVPKLDMYPHRGAFMLGGSPLGRQLVMGSRFGRTALQDQLQSMSRESAADLIMTAPRAGEASLGGMQQAQGRLVRLGAPRGSDPVIVHWDAGSRFFD